MRLRSQLMLTQLPWLLALLAGLWLAGIQVRAVVGPVQSQLVNHLRGMVAGHGMKDAMERVDAGTLFKLVGGREQGQSLALGHIRVFEQALQMAYRQKEQEGPRLLLDRIKATWSRYRSEIDALFAMEDPDLARSHYFERMYPLFLLLRDDVEQVAHLHRTTTFDKTDRLAVLFEQRLEGLAMAVLLLALASLAVTAWWQARTLLPLILLCQTTRQLGEGDLRARANGAGNHEVACLARDINTMAQSLEEHQRAAQKEPHRWRHTAQAAMEALPDPVLAFDHAGSLLHWNTAARAVLGSLQAGESFLHATDDTLWRSRLAWVLSRLLAGRGEGHEHLLMIHTPAGERTFQIHGHPVQGDMERPMAVVLVLRDVTQVKRWDHLQTDWVATVAHEFRTPLTSLHMAIHLCLDGTAGQVQEKQADLLQSAIEDCQRLANLVDELLAMTRLQSGGWSLTLAPLDAVDLLATTLRHGRDAALDKGIDLRLDPPPTPPLPFTGDSVHLQQVLDNLVHNAVQHTGPGGSIRVSAQMEEEDIRFQVEDSGQGMAPEYLSRVFERYFRIPGDDRAGAGLGLCIARDIVEGHGGKISVTSAPGQGSRFWFTIPRGVHGGGCQYQQEGAHSKDDLTSSSLERSVPCPTMREPTQEPGMFQDNGVSGQPPSSPITPIR